MLDGGLLIAGDDGEGRADAVLLGQRFKVVAGDLEAVGGDFEGGGPGVEVQVVDVFRDAGDVVIVGGEGGRGAVASGDEGFKMPGGIESG